MSPKAIETCDAGTDPPPPLTYDPFDLDARNLTDHFKMIQEYVEKPHDVLQTQNTTGAPKAIKDKVLQTLGTAVEQMEYFAETFDKTRTVWHRLQCMEREIMEIKTETRNLTTALQQSNNLGKNFKKKSKPLSNLPYHGLKSPKHSPCQNKYMLNTT